MSERPVTLADALDGVRWDFDPTRRILSPLVATARWFEDFPWDGEEGEAAPATPAAQRRPSTGT
ncbi:MAG TPA: hypothetical protein DD490_10175 [Acidobacteria bacterium]|nr:hypothetical protein [Acidobacteriota bacterium]